MNKPSANHPATDTNARGSSATCLPSVHQEGAATPKNSAVISVHATHHEAEDAVRTLQKSGFDMQRLSIVGKEYRMQEDVVGYYSTGDRMKAWGKVGAFWGGIWGMLFGSAFFFVPGIGPLLVAGPLVGWIIGALEGAVMIGGMSVVGAAFYSYGIPEDGILEYETHIKAGKFLVIAHGSPDEMRKAKDALNASTHLGVSIPAASD